MIYYGMDSIKTNTDETVAKEYQSAFFCNNTPILQIKKNIIEFMAAFKWFYKKISLINIYKVSV